MDTLVFGTRGSQVQILPLRPILSSDCGLLTQNSVRATYLGLLGEQIGK
jgi:hypothetical protein